MHITNDFLQRVLQKMPKSSIGEYRFESWSFSDKVTKEGVGLLPFPGVDADAIIARVMDVDHYRGHIDHVEECRAISDPRFSMPVQVRFYQKIRIPVLGMIQHELVLTDMGTIDGYRTAFWQLLEAETAALNPKVGFRSQYSDGAWLAGNGLVAYALSSAPRREDVGFLKWKALTKGADVSAGSVVKNNIEGMIAWANAKG